MNMSPEMKQFYIALQKWIDLGCPQWTPFDRRDSICGNLIRYFSSIGGDARRPLRVELQKQFVGQGLSSMYPFNYGIRDLYYQESDNFYKNPFRLYWIKQMSEVPHVKWYKKLWVLYFSNF